MGARLKITLGVESSLLEVKTSKILIMAKYFSAIIVCKLEGNREQFLKYRNIPENRIENLKRFALRFSGLHHINLYEKGTKKFHRQIGPKELGDTRR